MPINFKKLKVLVVEDNQAMRDVISAVMEGLDVGDVIYAKSGDQGFNKFKEHKPDIVITDWEMEPVDGIELIRQIRKNPQSPNKMVPVIFLTGYGAPERVKTARDAGVTEFLVKPFTADKLIQRITYVVNQPRDYVESKGYTGPDRRRIKKPDYSGPKRRKDDM
mgnify:CR=1 FL=1